VSRALDRVRQVAKRDRRARFTALLHHVTVDRLREAYLRLRKGAAPGVDGVTWEQYGERLEEHLRELHDRLHRGAYRAKPSRRAYIPKADGRSRPLGIAALEDKVVQRAVVEVMNAIYEADFLGFSYGFRPGRSQHQALDALAVGIGTKKVNYVLDADIRGFFDAIDHEWLMKFVEHRIADRRVLRLLRKWLAAGVMEDGSLTRSTGGTPQGATVSPLLANVYLHYVFDLWAQQWRKTRARGEMIVVRYADDFVVGFQYQADAERFLGELRERLRGFALELHPDKTRLLAFGRFAARQRRQRGERGSPETFHFLGFTHLCGQSKRGRFLLMRRTMAQRLRAKLKEVKAELMRRRHRSIAEQGAWLGQVVRGHYAYYAVPTNVHALQAFRTQVERHWRFALARRSQRGWVTWARMRRLSSRWLPPPRILHPWPSERFDVRTQGRSRVR
jgi:RNA-directed DNA polymerase